MLNPTFTVFCYFLKQKNSGDEVSSISRQTFIFSATLVSNANISQNLASKKKVSSHDKSRTLKDFIARLGLSSPTFVSSVTDNLLPDSLTESKIDCLDEDKDAILYYLLVRYQGRTIVFVNSIDAVRRLVPVLGVTGLKAVGLHSEMQQKQRLKNLER